MANNPNTPYGLQPIRRSDGAAWANSVRRYVIPAAYGSAVYVGDPVIKTAAGGKNGVNSVGLATAGATNPITGVVVGFEGIGPAYPPSLWGLAGVPGPIYRPASTSYDYYVLVNDDPYALFAVQADASATLTQASVGKNINLVAGAGSPYTGWSGWQVSSTSLAAGATLQMSVVEFLAEPDVIVGNGYPKLVVRANLHTEIPGQPGF